MLFRSTVEPENIRSALSSVKKTVEQCIRVGFSQDPSLWGRLALQLQFNRQGQMVRSDEYDSHFPDASVVKCASLAFRELRLAPQPEPTTIIVGIRIGTLPTLIGESNTELRPRNRASSNSSEP